MRDMWGFFCLLYIIMCIYAISQNGDKRREEENGTNFSQESKKVNTGTPDDIQGTYIVGETVEIPE